MIVPVPQTQKHNRYSMKELAAARHPLSQSLRSNYIIHVIPAWSYCAHCYQQSKKCFSKPNFTPRQLSSSHYGKKLHNSHGALLFKLILIFKTKSHGGVTKIVALLKTHIVIDIDSVTKQQLNPDWILPVFSHCINKIFKVTNLMLFNKML